MAKPVKTITGNDPNLAKAMAQMAGREPPLEEAMNKERQGWMQNQMSKAAAELSRQVVTV